MRTEHPPVRDTDPFTSWAAAVEASSRAWKLRELVADVLAQFGPMTHDQLIQAVNRVRPASPSGVRTRVSELVEDGLVEQVPDMVSRSALGRQALLWRLVVVEQPELPL